MFCGLVLVLFGLVHPEQMTFGMYKRVAGWALYVAYAALPIGMLPTGDTLQEVIVLRMDEILSTDGNERLVTVGMCGLMLLTTLIAPVFLLRWTRAERIAAGTEKVGPN